MTFYALFYKGNDPFGPKGFVVDTNQHEPRPPRLYGSTDAAKRRLAEERKHWVRMYTYGRTHRVQGSWIPRTPYDEDDWEIRSISLLTNGVA